MAGRPQVRISEISIPGPIISTATGVVAYVVHSEYGIPGTFLNIESEQDLVNTIGAPTANSSGVSATTDDFHVAKDFLNYGNDLVLVRAIDEDTARLARIGVVGSSIGSTGWTGDEIADTGNDVYFNNPESHTIISGNNIEFWAQSPFDSGSANFRTIEVAISQFDGTQTGESVWADNTDVIQGTTLFSDEFEFGPDDTNDEIALAVIVDGTIEEKFIVSLAPGAKNAQNENIYINDYLTENSEYIWGFSSGSAAHAAISSFSAIELIDGSKGSVPSSGDYETAYSKFLPKNEISFDYIIDGTHTGNRTYIIDTIAEGRKDCVAFVNTPKTELFSSNVPLSNTDTITNNIVTDRRTLSSSSWACYYGNWKQVYDKYQDKNIWIPITGSVAGVKVRANTDREVWTPAAGTVNGVVRNVINLAFNPSESQQDTLYKNGVNHVIFKPGKGYIVDGQKTMIDQNVGVSRLNVRELFRNVELFIGDIAEDFLHEFNDAVTRQRFKSIIDPFLEDIQNRGGLVRFETVVDESNNTAAVINSNGFRADIKIEGKRAIEDILLKFYDTPAGIAFDEVS